MSWLHCPGPGDQHKVLARHGGQQRPFLELCLAWWTTPVVSTRISVTERPNHDNGAAPLALRKLDVSNVNGTPKLNPAHFS